MARIEIVAENNSVEDEIVVDDQHFEPVTIKITLETKTQFKDLFHRMNICSERIEEEYFEDLNYARSAVNSSNAELWEVMKAIRKAQGLKIKNR